MTLVSGCTDDIHWFTNEVDIREWTVVDLRERLTMDPSSVGPNMDYNDELVITRVAGLDGFPLAIRSIIDSAVAAWHGDVKIFILGDLHIASVISACAESQLNSLVHTQVRHGYAPLRVCNCKWFSFNRCSGTWTWQNQVDNICDWIDVGGWEVADAPATESAMFGYAAAKKSMPSSTNWKALGFEIETDHVRIWHEAAWQEPRYEESKDEEWTSDAKWDRNREIDDDIEVPEWVTFNQDAKVWHSYLEKMNVDESAQQSLFLLAQSSPDNYWEANSIISKLIKKVVDGRELRNPSGFVFSSVLNVRNNGKPQSLSAAACRCDRCGHMH
jgi:hypothetical protein